MFRTFYIVMAAVFLSAMFLSCGDKNPVKDTLNIDTLGYDSIVMPVPKNCKADSIVIKDTTFTFTVYSALLDQDSIQYDSTIDTVQGCFVASWDSVKVTKTSPVSLKDTIMPAPQYSLFIYNGNGDLVRIFRTAGNRVFVGGLKPDATYSFDVASIDSIILDSIKVVYFISKRSEKVFIPVYLPPLPRDIRVHCTKTTAQVSWSAVPDDATVLGYKAYLRDEVYTPVDSLFISAHTRATAVFTVQENRAYKVNVVTIGKVGKSVICSSYVYDRSAFNDTGYRLPYVYLSSYAVPDENLAASRILGAGNMVGVPGGMFVMGAIWKDSTSSNTNRNKPVHEVVVSSFYMGRAEISNAVFMQYLRAEIAQGTVTKDSSVVLADTINDTVMVLDTVYTFFRNNDTVITAIRLHRDTNGAYSVADSLKQYPVTGVSWYGAILFCNWLSRQDNLSVCYDTATGMLDTMANGYRLPTEAEYEYVHSAAFLGTKQRYPWGYSENPEKYASFAKGIRAIGSFAPYYGFYDLTGNALEWCHDWSDNTAAADSGYYVLSKAAGVAHDPKGPVTGDVHVLRGGSYRYAGTDNASYYRYLIPTNGYADCGFRVARKSP